MSRRMERVIASPASWQQSTIVMENGRPVPSTFGGFFDLPGVRDAWAYVQDKLREWSALPKKFSDLSLKAYNLSVAAKAQGKPELANKVGSVITELTNVQSLWATTNEKLAGVLRDIKAAGFGIIPVVLGVALVAGVTVMVYVFKTVGYQERVLADIEKGLLPPGALPSGGSDPFDFGGGLGKAVGGALTPLILVGGGYLLWQMMQKKQRA